MRPNSAIPVYSQGVRHIRASTHFLPQILCLNAVKPSTEICPRMARRSHGWILPCRLEIRIHVFYPWDRAAIRGDIHFKHPPKSSSRATRLKRDNGEEATNGSNKRIAGVNASDKTIWTEKFGQKNTDLGHVPCIFLSLTSLGIRRTWLIRG